MRDTIDQIDVWACRVPLPVALDFGTYSVIERRYVAVRLRTAGGLTSDVIGHSRGSPIDVAIADLLSPRLIGTDPLDLAARRADFLNATVALERDGVLGRAWSLVELAFQGLGATARNMPVWRHLGGTAGDLAVQLVEGYALPGESDEGFSERLIARVHEGYTALKIEGGHYQDWKSLERRLQLIRRDAPNCRLVVDFGWSWRSAREHREALAGLGDLEIDWIEDAFPREAVTEYKYARQLTRAPLGCGDEATRVSDLLALVDADALHVVRLDATALGGYSAVVPLMKVLGQKGLRVSFHEFAEIHQHSALAGDGVDHVEMFPIDRPFDVRHVLTLTSAQRRVHRGVLPCATTPGLGITLDLSQVARYSIRHARLT